MMISRRAMIGITGRALAVGSSGLLVSAARAVEESFLPQGLPAGVYDTATLEALPGKKPLIKLSYRPPNYETPVSHFTSEFTPNDFSSFATTSPEFHKKSMPRNGGFELAARVLARRWN